MGKKYIIELPENTHWIQWIMEGTKDHHPYTDFKQVEDLTPYTEPDLEQVKSVYNAWYEKGLADAWDAAKKIALMDTETSENVTGYFGLFRIMENLTPMQAIEKLKAYEQEKEEQIQVGDEIRNKQTPDIRVCVTNVRGGRWDGFALSDVENYCRFGSGYNDRYLDGWEKTGRNFAAILQQMRDENVEQK